jgi:diguanylate cyclase
MGLRVVAEGIETAEIYQQLRALGCDEAQGYFMSRPLPAQQIEPWLAKRGTTIAS